MTETPSLGTFLKATAAILLLGIIAGLLWLWLANPAAFKVTDQGAILDEQASKGRFGVIVTFVLIGVVIAFLWGFFAGRVLHDRGWVMVPVFALLAIAAGLIAWKVGAILGPPDPATVKGAKLGDLIPQQLTIDTVAPFLVWPIFALIGQFLAVYLSSDRGHESARHRDEIIGG